MNQREHGNNSKLLPIGIGNISTIREDNFHYVDKTHLIHQLIREGRHYFLSRPRRFGKSLLINTLKNLFEGREELFQGLAIHSQWNWSDRHPVVRLSFDGKYNRPGDLERNILIQLQIIERYSGIENVHPAPTGPERLLDLLHSLYHAQGKEVVVLVDEYDKPISDVLDIPDLASENRDYLREFYSIIKGSNEYLRFVFVTGITMFSKANLFSGLNNLEDISLDSRYASICGFNDEEIDTVFASELKGMDRQKIRRWYKGYHWCGDHKLYNPWDILLLLKKREFDSYWFDTATPTYLYQLLEANNHPLMDLDDGRIERSQLTQFDVQNTDLRSLMFQSGYLTIAEEHRDEENVEYTLKYPNLEVCRSFNKKFLRYLGQDEVVGPE